MNELRLRDLIVEEAGALLNAHYELFIRNKISGLFTPAELKKIIEDKINDIFTRLEFSNNERLKILEVRVEQLLKNMDALNYNFRHINE